MSTHWTLSNINLYDILCPPKLKDYDKELGNGFSKEDIIYAHDQRDYNVYLVSKGKVKIVNYDDDGNEIVRQILLKGEVFGEHILLDKDKRTEYAVAYTNNTRVCAMNLTRMRDLMRENERFEVTIYKLIGWKLKKIQRRLDLLLGKDVVGRVSSFIYDLHLENDKELTFPLAFTHTDIAKLLATSRESVSKIFNQLKNKGILDYTRKEIQLKDVEQLVEFAKL
ncbi:MAG: Crp/Fnr family transcriptional regulator [Aureispira sp.]|nr:Crp/Fnr family transcriptional regulator [Aureispira sp.]